MAHLDFEYVDDLIIKNGDISLISHNDAIGQAIRDRLITFRGEWFLDLGFGPDYRKDILIKNPGVDAVSAALKEEILKTVEGNFTAFELIQKPNRKFEISFTLDTTNGIVTDTILI